MNGNRKKICMGLAAAVSVCFVVCLIGTIQVVVPAVQSGAPLPTGMIMLSLVTFFCAALIWNGVRKMD